MTEADHQARLDLAGSWAGLDPMILDPHALDDHVVGAADQEEMLDMIAADDDELPLTVEIEGVHEPKPRLAPATR